MLCKKCGKEICERDSFCSFCGEKNDVGDLMKTPLYPTIPLWKMIVLLLISFGAYPLVWGFQYWNQAAKNYDLSINRVIRAIFFSFTNFKLFKHINKYIENPPKENKEDVSNIDVINNYVKATDEKPIPATLFAIIYLVFCILSNTFSKLDLLNNLLSLISFIIASSVLLIIQSKINKINARYNLPAENNKWTWKTTGQVFIWIFMLLIIVSIFGSILTLVTGD